MPTEDSDHQVLSPHQAEAWDRLAELLTLLPAVIDAQLKRDAGLNHFDYRILDPGELE